MVDSNRQSAGTPLYAQSLLCYTILLLQIKAKYVFEPTLDSTPFPAMAVIELTVENAYLD